MHAPLFTPQGRGSSVQLMHANLKGVRAEFGALGALDVHDLILAALSKLATDKPKSVLSVRHTFCQASFLF